MRPLYLTLDEVSAKVPPALLLEALDDNADGVLDEDAWAQVAASACKEVDGTLGQRYTVPFPEPPDTPALVSEAAILFACETLYLRRGHGTKETNPFLTRAEAMRSKLDLIAEGRLALTPTTTKPRPSVSAITEPARTSSATGALSS
jgi:phage gp36-like protein